MPNEAAPHRSREAPRISVIVPTYRRCASVLRLLDTLSRQTTSSDLFEVIVIVDGSDDQTLERVRAYPAAFALKAHWQPNAGRAAACNAGLRAAASDLVVLLDDDMEPAPNFLQVHLASHEGAAGLGLMGAAPMVLERDAPGGAVFAQEKFNEHLEHLSRKQEVTSPRDFYSGNFSIRRETILAAKGFDEDFRIYGNEDVELFIRLRSEGVRIVFSEEAIAFQHYEKSSRDLARDSLAKGRTAVLVARKHPELAPSLRIGRLASLGGARLWAAHLASVGPVNRAAAGLLILSIPLLDMVGFRHSKRLYATWLRLLFWIGVVGAMRNDSLVPSSRSGEGQT